MSGGCGGLLAAEVTRGGGFGFVLTSSYSDLSIVQEINRAREALELGEADRIPIGAGFLGWKLEESGHLVRIRP